MAKPLVYICCRLPLPAHAMLEERFDCEVWEKEEPVPRAILLEKAARADGLLSLLTDRIARGGIVDEAALYSALKEGRIFAAGLDVFATEPVSLENPLLTLPNCICLPHIASASVQTRTRMATLAAENIIAALSGERPPTLVNPEVLERDH